MTRNKNTLHELSRSRMATWTDTAEKFLERRNAEHVKRLEEEELERRRLDQLEYEIQQGERDKTLQKALKQQYATLDQVKSFNAKLMMSDVMHERDLQLRLKQRKQEQQEGVERQWEEVERAKAQAYDDRLKQKLQGEYERRQE